MSVAALTHGKRNSGAHHRVSSEQFARQIVEGGVGLPHIDCGQQDGEEDDPDADDDADRRDAAGDQRGREWCLAAEGDQQSEAHVDDEYERRQRPGEPAS